MKSNKKTNKKRNIYPKSPVLPVADAGTAPRVGDLLEARGFTESIPGKEVSFEFSCPYFNVALEVVSLIKEKQDAYGDSFGQSHRIIEVLYPKGISPAQMPDALAVVRIIDKLFRIANQKDAFGEDPWQDIMGYALLASVRKGKDDGKKTKTDGNPKH